MKQINITGRFLTILVVTVLAVLFYEQRGLKLAQDLRGGTSLRFWMDIPKARAEGRVAGQDDAQVVADTLRVIDQRINASGLAEIELIELGENRFEINLPSGNDGDIDQIVSLVTTLGDLQFRIEVLPDALYRQDSDSSAFKRQRFGVWTGSQEEFTVFKEAEVKSWQAAQSAGTAYVPSRAPYRVVPRQGATPSMGSFAFAVVEDPASADERFDGAILENPAVSKDNEGRPVTVFDVKNKFRGSFQAWTGRNVQLPMSIILNGEHVMAPVINQPLSDHVQVTLGATSMDSARKQAEELKTTLQTGSLKLRPVLEARTKVGARLAGESRDRGILATLVALGLVLVFMLIYYRWMGLVANVALVLNLVLLVGALAFADAALSLPGIAGIVLTLGVAVDANILINERIREERALGRNLHRALDEGYSRALTTIVDSNMTSIITAVFLYAYGSGAIRGFAVSLVLGLLISMFTAIFVTRAIFEWQLKRGSLREFKVTGSGKVPSFRWMANRTWMVPLSVLLVVGGIFLYATTDRLTLYDIDFTGGQKVQMRFAGPVTVDEVKRGLRGEPVEVEVSSTYFDKDEQLQVRRQKVAVGPLDGAEVFTVGDTGDSVELKVQRATARADLNPEEEEQALRGYLVKRFEGRLLPAWQSQPARRVPAATTPRAAPAPGEPAPAAPAEAPAAADPALAAVAGGIATDLSFVDPRSRLTPAALEGVLAKDFPHFIVGSGTERRAVPASDMKRTVVVRPAATPALGTVRRFDVWVKTTTKEGTTSEDAEPERFSKGLEQWLGSPAFRTALARELGVADVKDLEDLALSQGLPSQDQISASVAQRLKNDALVALSLSLLGIIVYVALRFRSTSMGLASVLCLFHDVAVTAGVVALANSMGWVDARVNLTMVAAFLTLVGLSINDTVVIYDRIRENRGRAPGITSGMIDLSLNQTFGRTLKTITTILLVCCALFFFNYGQRNVLEGFAFCLIVGSFVGTYSSVAIASPLLLFLPWVWLRLKGLAPSGQLVSACAGRWVLMPLLPLALVAWLAWAVAFSAYAFAVGLVLFTPWALSGKADAASDAPATPAASA
ncbi:MAG: protein translocase subunit SecD [Planctomycetia bacterium]